MTRFLVTLVKGRGTPQRQERQAVARAEASDDLWKLDGIDGWEVVAAEELLLPWEKR